MSPAAPRTAGSVGNVRVFDAVARVVGAVSVGAVAIGLLAPAGLAVAQSFSNDSFFSFPPSSWGLRQYRTLFATPRWGSAFLLSVRIGLTVALLSALIVVPATLTLHRSRLPGRHAALAGGVAGLVIPVSAYAVALYGVFVQLGLLGSELGIVLAHTALAVPVMLLVTAAAMTRLPIELELAAMAAGAPRWRAWWGITVRLLAPAILAGALLAFVTSFDEAVFIVFLGGAGLETLPRAILNSVRIGIDPVVTAIGTLVIVGTSVLMLGALLIGRRTRREL